MIATDFRIEKEELLKQQNSLKQVVIAKDKEIMAIKAHEYDKVDMIKALAESEAKNKVIGEELDRKSKIVIDLEANVDQLNNENHRLSDSLQQVEYQFSQMK